MNRRGHEFLESRNMDKHGVKKGNFELYCQKSVHISCENLTLK